MAEHPNIGAATLGTCDVRIPGAVSTARHQSPHPKDQFAGGIFGSPCKNWRPLPTSDTDAATEPERCTWDYQGRRCTRAIHATGDHKIEPKNERSMADTNAAPCPVCDTHHPVTAACTQDYQRSTPISDDQVVPVPSHSQLSAQNESLRLKLAAAEEVVKAAQAFDVTWRKGPKEGVNDMLAARLAMRAALDTWEDQK